MYNAKYRKSQALQVLSIAVFFGTESTRMYTEAVIYGDIFIFYDTLLCIPYENDTRNSGCSN